MLIAAILLLNAGISYWNAYVCGKSWVEAHAVGGPVKFMVWCGAIQSAIGFSSVIALPLMYGVHALLPGYFTDVYFKGAISLWYLSIIFPALGTGFAIMIESWVAAYRERSLLNMGSAAWNTFAQIHNTVSAFSNIGSAFGSVAEAIGKLIPDTDDDDGEAFGLAVIGVAIMIITVVVSLLGGAFLTYMIIQRYSGTVPLPNRDLVRA
jgi:hypothetical protein